MDITFSFGRNWVRYVRFIVNEDIIGYAVNSLKEFMGDDFSFDGKTFIDIGCGSGLFSLSAGILGCRKVISIDVDSESLRATHLLKAKFAHMVREDIEWEVLAGSILDNTISDQFGGQGDIVYSWGVLHHTGDVKSAMKNAGNLVKENGILCLALYNRTEASDWWLRIKQFYNRHFFLLKGVMVAMYFLFLMEEHVRKGRSPFKLVDKRGMHELTDIVDWLGGLPYEPLTLDEVVAFYQERGFALVRSNATRYSSPVYPKALLKKYFVYFKQVGLGNNQFLFSKKSS